ncbi:hypothetical protein BIY24_13350 [Halobacteriovorax marinus]|uniref:hypothetical protein n=1 Tax=Halobacteriovorax marinus TaxID=97084 RepID=UPI000BC2F105|nr:hypothetical protein [Halobacteriovorax marinus]ATH08896.1 hypothetical protein BIY24_13350 [Halobacteriovorax marinus]
MLKLHIKIFIIILLCRGGEVCAQGSFKEKIDTGHSMISEKFGKSVNRLDNFVFTEKELNKDTGSRIYFFNKISFSNDGQFLNEINYRLSLRLPRLSKSLQLSFDSNNKTPVNGNSDEGEVDSSDNRKVEEKVEANLHHFLKLSKLASMRTSGGLTASSQPQIFSKLYFSREDSFQYFNMTTYLGSEWYSRDRFSQSSGITLSKKISDLSTFRYVVEQGWRESTNIVSLSTGPSYIYFLSKRRSIEYNFRFDYENKPHFYLTNLRFFINYRQKLHKDWLYYDLGPYISFSREENFKQVHGAYLKLEVAFGEF